MGQLQVAMEWAEKVSHRQAC